MRPLFSGMLTGPRRGGSEGGNGNDDGGAHGFERRAGCSNGFAPDDDEFPSVRCSG